MTMQIVITTMERCDTCRLHRGTNDSYKECTHESCPTRDLILLHEEQERLQKSRDPRRNTRGAAGYH